MLETILGFLHNATTLLFGVYLSAAILGLKLCRKNNLILFSFSCIISIFFVLSYITLGEHITEQLYPLIIHLPLVLFLTLFYKFKSTLCIFSVSTAYLCCQISNWVGILVGNLTNQKWIYFSVRIVVSVIVFILFQRFVCHSLTQFLNKPTRAIMILSIMPFVYYFFDYATSVYTSLLYSGIDVIAEFLGFVLCITYIIFLLLYFKQYEEKCETERRNELIQMQYSQSQKELETIRRSERAVSIMRHDMRHFLTNLSTLIENGNLQKAQNYINDIISISDKTYMHKYCKNEIVNLILSSHENTIKNNNIDYKYNIRIPEKLPFSDVDITAILSNAIENAIKAVMPLDKEKRYIELDIRMHSDKLLISLKNTFAEKPVFIDGIPQARDSNHGVGTQSIQYVSEKLNGNCQFSINDNLFILRVII